GWPSAVERPPGSFFTGLALGRRTAPGLVLHRARPRPSNGPRARSSQGSPSAVERPPGSHHTFRLRGPACGSSVYTCAHSGDLRARRTTDAGSRADGQGGDRDGRQRGHRPCGGHAPRAVPTAVTRAAGINLTKGLANEYASSGIRVNTICLGLVKSEQWERRAKGGDVEAVYREGAKRVPLGRMGEAEEFGDLVAFLVSARAAFITGTAINFDGGMGAVV